jgi:hypothetical protein
MEGLTETRGPFLTNWSSIPGELEVILGQQVHFSRDHLTRGLHDRQCRNAEWGTATARQA